MAVSDTAAAGQGGLAGADGEVVLPWLDQPAANPVPEVVGRPLIWENLSSWYTPNDEFFTVKHYNEPTIDAASYRLQIDGLVDRPTAISLEELCGRRRREIDYTLECSGNTGLPFFIGGVGNARWAGTPLAPLLREVGITDAGREVVFWGADGGAVQVAAGWSPGVGGGPGSTLAITEQFARSMSIDDALDPDLLLCWEMNGEPLPPEHGAPLRLIAPGWYGVANVKWLTRIEVREQRFAGRFMARDYVTIREEQVGGTTNYTFATVGHGRLKSAPARVARQGDRFRIDGAAWGAAIAAVEVCIDGGDWQEAELTELGGRHNRRSGGAWVFWTFPWHDAAPGEHAVSCRAIDADGTVQPEPTDPYLAAKRTYWESNGIITRRVLVPA